MRPLRTIHHLFVGSTAVALGSLAAVMVVHGGWQAVAAALAIFAGLVSLISFIAFATASERPPRRLPAWADESEKPRAVQLGRPAPAPEEPATAPLIDHSHGGRTVTV